MRLVLMAIVLISCSQTSRAGDYEFYRMLRAQQQAEFWKKDRQHKVNARKKPQPKGLVEKAMEKNKWRNP